MVLPRESNQALKRWNARCRREGEPQCYIVFSVKYTRGLLVEVVVNLFFKEWSARHGVDA